MVSKWKEKESPLKCQRVAEINTVILLVLDEFVIDHFQKKFHQADVATEADHVVADQDHVTDAPAQEAAAVAEEAVMSDHTEPVTV